jgi:hypothetical protein
MSSPSAPCSSTMPTGGWIRVPVAAISPTWAPMIPPVSAKVAGNHCRFTLFSNSGDTRPSASRAQRSRRSSRTLMTLRAPSSSISSERRMLPGVMNGLVGCTVMSGVSGETPSLSSTRATSAATSSSVASWDASSMGRMSTRANADTTWAISGSSVLTMMASRPNSAAQRSTV